MIGNFILPNGTFSYEVIIPQQPKPRKISLMRLVKEKIQYLIKRIWKIYVTMREKFPALNDRQIKLIDHITKVQINPPLQTAKVMASVPPYVPILDTEPLNPQKPEEPVLAKMCTFLEKFVDIVVNECIYNHEIAPISSNWKTQILEKIEGIKPGMEVVYNIQNSLSSLVELIGIGNFKDPMTTIVIQQLFQVFLLSSGEEQHRRDKIEKLLKAKIEKLLEENKITQGHMESIVKKIPTVLNWLFHSNSWLLNTDYPFQLHNFFLDIATFVETFSNLLKEGSLDKQIDEIKNLVEKNFEDDLKLFLKTNTQSISSFMAARVANLIEHLDFSEMLDEILKGLQNHLQGWIASDNNYKVEESLIADAEKAVGTPAKTGAQSVNQEKAQEFIDLVKAKGGFVKSENSKVAFAEAKKAYLNKRFDEVYITHKSCHHAVSSEQKIELVEQEKAEEFYTQLLHKFYSCLLPSQKIVLPSGYKVDVNGIVKLIDLITLPPGLSSICDLCNTIFNLVIENNDYEDKERFKHYFFALSKMLTVEILSDRLEQQLFEKFRQGFNLLASPDFLDFFATTSLFPLELKRGFIEWTRSSMALSVNEIAPFFHALTDQGAAADTFAYTDPNEALLSFLYKLMKSKVKDFSFDSGGISVERFKELIQPLINEITYHLRNKFKESGQILTVQQVSADIVDFLAIKPVPPKDIYGHLAMTLLFDIGEFGGKVMQTVMGVAQSKISQEVSTALHEISKSYHLLVSNLVAEASKELLNPDNLNKILFPDQPFEEMLLKNKPKTEASFNEQIRILSQLWHDSLYCNLEAQSGFLTPYYLATPSSSEIEQLVTKLFRKVLSRPLLNKSLLLNVTDIFARFLEKGATAIDGAAEIPLQTDRVSITKE